MNERRIGIIIGYINIVLHTVIGFAYVPILLHYIGKSEYGLYQLIGSFIAYFSVMDFGLNATVARFYARYKALNDNIRMENILAIIILTYVVITVIIFASGVGVYINLSDIFSSSMNMVEIKSAENLFLLLLFNVLVNISTMIFKAIINAHEKFLFLKSLETIQMVLQPILIILFIKDFPSSITIASLQTILNVSLTMIRIYYCFNVLKIKIKYHYWDKELFSDFKKLAFSVFVVTVIDQIFFKTNQVILGVVSGAAAVAVYSVSSLIYMNYMSLSTAISGVYLPHITTLVAKNSPVANLTDIFISVGRMQYFLLALVGSGFAIFGQQFIYYWAGDGFEEAYLITLLIIIPFTIDLIQNIGLSIMQAQNRYDFRAKVYCIMGIFNFCLAIPLALKYGGIGCAFATGVAMFLGNGVIMNWYYYKITKLDILRFWKEIGWISIWVLMLTIIGFGFNNLLMYSSKFIFVSKIVIYTVAYIVIMYIMCMKSEEKYKVNQILNKIRIKIKEKDILS